MQRKEMLAFPYRAWLLFITEATTIDSDIADAIPVDQSAETPVTAPKIKHSSNIVFSKKLLEQSAIFDGPFRIRSWTLLESPSQLWLWYTSEKIC
jgi:hypothetical protein